MNNILDFIFDEDGQGLVEYGLLLILVAVIVFAGLRFLVSALRPFTTSISRTAITQHHKK